MKVQKPGPAGHVAAIVLAGAQAWWTLTVDPRTADRVPPLFPEPWQKLLSCVFVGGVTLGVAAVRPGESVKSEFFFFAVRSILIGAVLTFFFFEAVHLSDTTSGWEEFPNFLLAWPVVSLSVFGVTAGDAPTPPPSPPFLNAG